MDNKSFWNERYTTLPDLGSGPGSRGYAAAYKAMLVRRTAEEHRLESVADIGCGDLCWLESDFPVHHSYRGYDISDVIIRQNEAAYASMPSVRFALHDIAAAPLPEAADLVVCFDVLIHQVDRTVFLAALDNILASIRHVGLVSYLTPRGPDGSWPKAAEAPEEFQALEQDYERLLAALPVGRPSGATAFHGPLPDCVHQLRGGVLIEPIARYRRQTVYRLIPQ